jgi:6-phosphogluconate dehydrogenase
VRIGLIGLGRMGAGLAARLLEREHTVVGFDLSAESVGRLVASGGEGAGSIRELVDGLEPPRAVWLMVPHGAPTRDAVEALLPLLAPGDTVIDGGNSRYLDSMAHAERCAAHGVRFLDVGVSGGVWGTEAGFNLMIGGPEDAFAGLEPVFRALAPEGGYARVGPSGAGHFVKMIHNAMEYGMLQAMGEGFECLRDSEFDLDLAQVAELWRHGSVVRSWLLDLLGHALREDGSGLDAIGARVDDSGTGRWAVEYALERGIPLPAITVALFERYDSRIPRRFSHQVIAALRRQFGGHPVTEG